MDILKWIDVAFGVIFVYLVFSLGVTAFNEAIATVLSSRAKWLRKGVAALLTPAPSRAESDAGGSKPTPAGTAQNEQGKPEGAQGVVTKVKSALLPEPELTQPVFDSPFISFLGTSSGLKRRFKPSYITPWAMFQSLLDAAAKGGGAPLATMDAIEKAANELPLNSPIRAAADDLIARAEGKVERLRELVDEWFRNFDDQVRSWYRQKTQYMLWLLSLVLAVTMNIDTIAILEKLSIDGKTRAALVEQGVKTAEDDTFGAIFQTKALTKARDEARAASNAVATAKTELDKAKKAKDDKAVADSTTALASAELAAKDAESAIATEQAKFQQKATDMMSGVSASGLPLGWSHVDTKAMSTWGVFVKLLGLLLSAAALSLGAPFWFDMLKKVASIRAVGLDLIERKKKQAVTAAAA